MYHGTTVKKFFVVFISYYYCIDNGTAACITGLLHGLRNSMLCLYHITIV